MSQLESNFSSISGACETLNNSFTTRRSQLEKLNGVKKNLTKLQFLMDLPRRLQHHVDEGQHELAVRTYRTARKMLNAVGNVVSFERLRAEAALIMRRLTQSLYVRLEEDSQLPADELGLNIWLLLQLDGNESLLIQDYLNRRRRAIQEELMSLSVLKTIPAAASRPGALEESSGLAAAPILTKDQLFAPASFVRHVGLCIVPQLVQMFEVWNSLFLETPLARDAQDLHKGTHVATGNGGKVVSQECKELMLLQALKELFTGLLETCQRRLGEEDVKPGHLLQALGELLNSLDPLNMLMPQWAVGQVSQIALGLARRSMDKQLGILHDRLGGVIRQLVAPIGDEAANSQKLQERVKAAALEVVACVRDVLHNSAPLVVPLTELLNMRADGMTRHLIDGLHSALRDVSRSGLVQPSLHPRGVLLCAGFYLRMAYSGISQVPAMLKELLLPCGLGIPALSFDAASLIKEMTVTADQLLKCFVGMQVLCNECL